MTAPGYTVMPAPQSLSPVDPRLALADLAINYEAHPAYVKYVRPAGLGYKISTTVSFAAKFVLPMMNRLFRYAIKGLRRLAHDRNDLPDETPLPELIDYALLAVTALKGSITEFDAKAVDRELLVEQGDHCRLLCL